MSAMAVFAGLQIAGSVFGFMGQRQADEAQAEQELLNADFFDKQAELSKFETARELDIFSREAESAIGSSQSALSRSGVSFSGSAVSAIAQGELQARKEKTAIKAAGQIKVELAELRANQARQTADALQSRGGAQAMAGLLNLGASLVKK